MDKENQRKRQKEDAQDSGVEQTGVDIVCDYEQTEDMVTMSLDCSTDQTDRKIIFDASESNCNITLEDGREWHCEFYRNILDASFTVATRGPIVEISVAKTVSEIWPRLSKDVHIQHLKSDIYEKDKDYITVCFYVKNVIKDSLFVDFKARELTVAFNTSDPKFLSSHDNCDKDTRFVYRKRLRDAVVTELCRVEPLTTSTVSVNMRKRTAAKWDSLEEDPQRSGSKSFPIANEWIAVGDRCAAVATCSDVVDDEAQSVPVSPDAPLVASFASEIKKFSADAKVKPTCMVPPLNMDTDRLGIGLTGLDNMGNTCFMNSVIQTLINTREFRDFFLGQNFQFDINIENPLGFKGQLAITFALLCRILWSGKHRSCEPSKLKMLVASRASQFTGFAQHDAQEFMAFLLDGLHEDLNRIEDRPYIETKDWDGEPDEVFANECWRRYKLRNDSVVVDLFQGQYKSKLVCPACQHVSITFDPFLYLSVPLPKKYRYLPIYFFTKEPSQKPIRLNMKISADTTLENLKDQIAKRTSVPTINLRIFEVYKSKVHRFLRKGVNLSLVTPKDLIFAFEVLSAQSAGKPVVEISVIQRVMMPSRSSKCSFCDRYYPPGIDPQLKRCTKCYRASYCDITCQKSHWSSHKASCKFAPELVGMPFILSLPQSKATYSTLSQMMESYARYSVDLFHPPVQTVESAYLSNATVTSASRCSSIEESGGTSESQFPVGSFDLALASGDDFMTAGSCRQKDDENKRDALSRTAFARESSIEPRESPDVASESSAAYLPTAVNPVIGQSRLGSRVERTDPLFYIQPVNQLGISLIGAAGERLQDAGDAPIDLTATTFVSMDWRNNEKMKNYVLVQSRNLEVDENLSDADYLEEQGHFTLDQCLRLFTEPETLTPDEAWYCPKCRQHREATKQMSIWRLPAILIVQLKRFSFKGYLYKDKIDKLVDYPIRGLDLSPYYCGPQFDGCDHSLPTPPVYDLYAVINHYGNILGGHYTAMAQLLGKEGLNKSDIDWRLFDDSHVAWEPESSAVSRSAYVLFYRRRGVIANIHHRTASPPSSCSSDGDSRAPSTF